MKKHIYTAILTSVTGPKGEVIHLEKPLQVQVYKGPSKMNSTSNACFEAVAKTARGDLLKTSSNYGGVERVIAEIEQQTPEYLSALQRNKSKEAPKRNSPALPSLLAMVAGLLVPTRYK